MPYGIMQPNETIEPEQEQTAMPAMPEVGSGAFMGGAPADFNMGVDPMAELSPEQQAMEAEYHALHGSEAVHKIAELDRAAKFRRALGMMTETFATIAGRPDIAAQTHRNMVNDDQQRASAVHNQILAHIGVRALERERESRAMMLAVELEKIKARGAETRETKKEEASAREIARREAVEDRDASNRASAASSLANTKAAIDYRNDPKVVAAEAARAAEISKAKLEVVSKAKQDALKMANSLPKNLTPGQLEQSIKAIDAMPLQAKTTFYTSVANSVRSGELILNPISKARLKLETDLLKQEIANTQMSQGLRQQGVGSEIDPVTGNLRVVQ